LRKRFAGEPRAQVHRRTDDRRQRSGSRPAHQAFSIEYGDGCRVCGREFTRTIGKRRQQLVHADSPVRAVASRRFQAGEQACRFGVNCYQAAALLQELCRYKSRFHRPTNSVPRAARGGYVSGTCRLYKKVRWI